MLNNSDICICKRIFVQLLHFNLLDYNFDDISFDDIDLYEINLHQIFFYEMHFDEIDFYLNQLNVSELGTAQPQLVLWYFPLLPVMNLINCFILI